eukprot:1184309-Prorocentrum_minimum.AAC.1
MRGGSVNDRLGSRRAVVRHAAILMKWQLRSEKHDKHACLMRIIMFGRVGWWQGLCWPLGQAGAPHPPPTRRTLSDPSSDCPWGHRHFDSESRPPPRARRLSCALRSDPPPGGNPRSHVLLKNVKVLRARVAAARAATTTAAARVPNYPPNRTGQARVPRGVGGFRFLSVSVVTY